MSRVEQIVSEALANDVVLYLKDGKLAYVASGSGVSDALRGKIGEHKEELIDYLRQLDQARDAQQLKLPEIQARAAGTLLPLSFSQQRLWFIDKFEGGSTQFNMVNVFRFEGRLDVAAFERALHTIVQRHEALRTVFSEQDGEARQAVTSSFSVPLTRLDLSHVSRDRQHDEVTSVVAKEANTSFDLSRDLLLRTILVTLSDTESVVVFNVHHIASDGWSLSLLVQEFSALYAAYCRGAESPLAPLHIQYADYALWQRDWLRGEVLERQLAYWAKRLDSIPPVHAIPLDNPRPAQQTFNGKFHVQSVDAELTGRLRQLSQQHDVTMFILLQSVFALLVGRFSNETDIVMGTPVAGRPHKDTEALIGFFVNSLVLRTSLAGNPTFSDYLRQNREAILADYAHQQVPFEMLVERLKPERNLAHSPLFQVVFGLNNNENRQLELPGLTLSMLPNEVGTAKVDLELSIVEIDNTLRVLWSFNSDIFVTSSIEAMAAAFDTLLQSVVDRPSSRILALPLLRGEQREKTLGMGVGARWAVPDDALVQRAFERNVPTFASSMAVSCGETQLTYAQLNEKANRLAHYLKDIGLGPGARVGVYLKRSVEQLIGVLGIMKAGAVYVPLEPAHPRERVDFIVRDASVELVLTEQTLVEGLTLGGFDILTMDGAADSHEWLAEYPTGNLPGEEGESASERLLYILYTSGSTGKPKGVMVPHRGVYNYLAFAADTYFRDDIQGAVVSSPLCFDATLTTFLAPLFAGKPVVLLPDDESTLERLEQSLFDDECWLFKITPAHLDALGQRAPAREGIGTRHVIVVGGEQLTSATLLKWKDSLLPRATFVNEYGPTETVVGCSIYTVASDYERENVANRPAVPIGRAIQNTELYVLNAEREPQPVNCLGELYIGGAGVAKGYVNLRAETDAKFVADPFCREPARRLYRTGDWVRWLPDGNLEFIGRADDQVKIRGYRIELGEIEGQLRLIDGAREAAVIVSGHDESGESKQLVAYVVAERADGAALQDATAFGQRCRARLLEILPDYMVPSVFVVLDEMPLSANGKIDRKRLPAADLSMAPRSLHSPPTTPEEVRLCAIWQDLLKLERVGTDDNFFELGGHSLLALRLIGRVRDEFGVELSLRMLFANPTIASLASTIHAGTAAPVLPPIVRAGNVEAAPLSFAQRRLWFIDRMQGGSIQYNMPGTFRLDGSLSVQHFAKALSEVFRRHDILRTEFVEQGDVVVQRVRSSIELPLRTLDLSSLSPDESDREVARLCRLDAETPFDLKRDPLLRVTLLRKSASEHIVVFNMHHIASDGWSMGVLVKEFGELYAACVEDREPNLAELPVQYSDYARWQDAWLTPEVLDQGIAYWEDRLSGIPAVHSLPLDRPRPATASYKGAAYAQRLSEDVVRQIHRVCRESGATLSMFLQTALAVVLGRWSGETDIVMGSTVAGRSHRDLEPLIGFFVNSVVLRTDVSGNPAFAELLAATKRNVLEDFNHQYVPFEALVEALNPERSMSYSPLFQVAFSLHNQENVQMALPGLTFSAIQQDIATSHFELVLNVNEVNGELLFTWVYNSDIFDAGKIGRIAESYGVLLANVAADIALPIRSVAIVTPDTARRLELHGPASDLCAQASLHELFERQAELRPDQDAVVCGSRRITYRSLREKSDRLARYLVDIGIRREARIGICLERSIEMMIAILGIAKAGAAYVPLEPSHPADRIRYIVQDAAVELVVLSSPQMDALSIEGVDVLLMDQVAGNDDWLEEYGVACASAGGASALPTVDAENLLYVLYTSGSTGKPKGVMITHGGVANYLQYAGDHYLGDGIDAAIVSSPLCFDATVTSLLVPLCYGKPVVLLPDDDDVLAALAGYVFQAEAAYLFKITPAHLEALAHTPSTATASPMPHVVVVGGEQLAAHTLLQWRNTLPAATFVNEYGPTETVVGCSTFFVRPEDSVSEWAGQAAVPIGKPIANTALYVMNEQRQLQPAGSAGELYIGGAGVACGYVNLAEMTSQRFVQNPLSARSDDRLYRTGDLVRLLPSGELEFIGRADNQVKIRGFRIETGEIESELRSIPGLQDAVVVLDQSDPDDKQLVAYATIDVGRAPAAARTAKLLAQQRIEPENLYRIGNGMEVYGLNKAETEYLYDEIFVHKVYDRHGISVREGDCVFDVGANIGAFSIYLATRFERLTVHSFEPIPVVHRRLDANSAIFGVGKIVPHCLGLSDREKEATFSFYPNVSLYSGLDKGRSENIDIVKTFLANKAVTGSQDNALSNDMLDVLTADRMKTERVDVRLSTISEQIRTYGIQSIDLLKIDVERSEIDVLRGIEHQDWGKIKQVVVEVHNVDGAIEYVTSLLESHEFDVVLDQDSDLEGTELFNLYARRPASTSPLPEIRNERWQGLSDLRKDVRSRLGRALPEYMVPSAILFLDAIPLTHNGKVDRKKLPGARGADVRRDVYVAPRNAAERSLCEIWARLLKLERVGIHDNFFDLGGHSLLALRLISQVRQEFDAELAIRSLFEHPTVAQLSALLRFDSKPASMPPIAIADRDGDLMLSYAQQRIWFLDAFSGGSLEYSMPSYFVLEGTLDLRAVRYALQEILCRHEVLRTRFAEKDGDVFQVVSDTFALPLSVVDLSELSSDEQQAATRRLVQAELRKPFDLRTDLMLRAQIVVLSPERHCIIFNMHHIASDGWSMGILLREFSDLYAAFTTGGDNPLPPLPVQYADFAQWQRRWLHGEVLDEQLAYWRDRLANLPRLHSLPLDKPRPSKQTHDGHALIRTFDSARLDGIMKQCREANVTLFMFLETAFALLLSRYSGESDIVVGTPVAGRVHRDVEPLIGCFLNSLVLRTQVDADATFSELLQGNRDSILSAFSHQHAPFEMLVEALRPERSLSHSPLFQIMFILQNNERAELSLPGLRLAPAERQADLIKFDLELICAEAAGGLVLNWSYNRNLFSESLIAQLADSFDALVSAIVKDPAQQCAALPLLNASDRASAIALCSGPATTEARDSLQAMFERQAMRTPDAPAVACGGRTLTYRDLNDQANRLAHYLLTRGIGSGDVVGLCLPRSSEMVVAMLGVLKAGCAYLPLDPHYPKGRIHYMVKDAGSVAVLTTRAVLERVALREEDSICIDEPDCVRALSTCSSENVSTDRVAADGAATAYLIYTSGSTGQPKGVEVSHASVVNFLTAMRTQPGLAPGEKLLAVTPISFDIHVLEIYLPLVVGGSLVVATRDDCLDGDALAALVEDESIDVMQATPATWKLMLLGRRWGALPKIKMLCGGEALDRGLADRLLERATSLWNMYGPTETTVWSSCAQILLDGSAISVGRPIRNTQLFVLDGNRRLQPPGVFGELYIGGSGLAKGYRNRVELTQERFVDIEGLTPRPMRLYRTGDLARWRFDGQLECGGRLDRQIKIRGFRVETGEVEMKILQQSPVLDCAVVDGIGPDGERRLIAYVVAANVKPELQEAEQAVAREELTRWIIAELRNELPEYMIPSVFHYLGALPLTANGKVDRLALPEPDTASRLSGDYVAPRNAIEARLCEIWAQLLHLDRVGIRDDFFELGGHSLLVTRLLSAVRNEFQADGIELAIKEVFEMPTVEAIAAAIEAKQYAARMRQRELLFSSLQEVEEGEV